MAMNDRNNQKGKLGELRVAEAFVQQGCVVNFLSFMDVGLDLHVQLPKLCVAPAAEDKSWEMSGHAVHVQVKSTGGRRLPSIAVSTARAWSLGAATGVPTLLVGVIVSAKGNTQFRLFDPLLVDFLAERAAQAGRTSFTAAVGTGEVVAPDALLAKAAFWLSDGPFLFSQAITRPWSEHSRDIWKAAVEMICATTVMFERRFRDTAEVFEGQTFVATADRLAYSFLQGAGVATDALDDNRGAGTDSIGDEMRFQVSESVYDVVSEKHGWSDHVQQLAAVTRANDEAGALNSLADMFSAYGHVVQGKLLRGQM